MEKPLDPDLDDPDLDEDGPSVLEEAFLRYRENGLRLPPVPRDLVGELDEFADWRWGSDQLDLEDPDDFIADAHAAGGDDDVAFGHVGHGVSSWWLCYRLKRDSVAVYVRAAFGGLYKDPEVTVPRVNAIAASLETLIPAADAAKTAGRFRGGHRLIVVIDDQSDSFWEIAGGPDSPQPSEDPIADAMSFLSEPFLPEPGA